MKYNPNPHQHQSSMSVQSLGLSNGFACKWLLLGPTYKGHLPKLAKMHEALHLVLGEDRGPRTEVITPGRRISRGETDLFSCGSQFTVTPSRPSPDIAVPRWALQILPADHETTQPSHPYAYPEPPNNFRLWQVESRYY